VWGGASVDISFESHFFRGKTRVLPEDARRNASDAVARTTRRATVRKRVAI
jgi:hypothetical protein